MGRFWEGKTLFWDVPSFLFGVFFFVLFVVCCCCLLFVVVVFVCWPVWVFVFLFICASFACVLFDKRGVGRSYVPGFKAAELEKPATFEVLYASKTSLKSKQPSLRGSLFFVSKGSIQGFNKNHE